jgi:hypothetical protein
LILVAIPPIHSGRSTLSCGSYLELIVPLAEAVTLSKGACIPALMLSAKRHSGKERDSLDSLQDGIRVDMYGVLKLIHEQAGPIDFVNLVGQHRFGVR